MSDLAWMRPKLAELCGLRTDEQGDYRDPKDNARYPFGWRPDEDVAQAVRCLEALGLEYAWTIRQREVTLRRLIGPDWDPEWNPTHIAFTASISHNICLAIAAALGREADAARDEKREGEIPAKPGLGLGDAP